MFIRPPVWLSHLENMFTNLDEIRYGCYAIRVSPQIALFHFLAVYTTTNMPDERTFEVGSALAPLAAWSYSDGGNSFLKKYTISVRQFFV
jgi:hypothetical protein